MALRDKPINIDERNWYYEEESKICLVHEVYVGNEYIQTDQIDIPWKRILESVRRKYPDKK